jgi:hypothetical protein
MFLLLFLDGFQVNDTLDLTPPDVNLGARCFTGLVDDLEPHSDHDLKELEDVVYDGLENLAGFICKKFQEPNS